MSLRFAASDVGSTIYVIAGDKKKAQAWIRRQATPARYVYCKSNDLIPSGATEVVAFTSTLPVWQHTDLRLLAAEHNWKLRVVF